MKNVIVITGPTATGKTELAIKLAKKINGEIISADSRQVYKYFNIGTNKPTRKQLSEVPHHLINIVEPTEQFTAGDFVRLANKKIKQIFKSRKQPIIVGGTGFYIKALIDGLIKVPKTDKKLRLELRKTYKRKGLNYLCKQLEKLDPETAEIIDKKNPVRVLRALEIYFLTGKKVSELKKEICSSRRLNADYNFLIFGLKTPRQNLHKCVNSRVEQMIYNGLIDETKKLVKKYSSKNPILQLTIGYQEIIGYLDGRYSKAEAIQLIKQHTRQYAKRQMTWFKKEKKVWGIVWIDIKNNPTKKILNYFKKSDII
ncbi:MAG: tRNA (adenosine(37)-N6)-dimethylallyltransferase MiaA [Elusimicrobiota bacterium]